MLEEIIVAGFGGQGVLRLGQLITYAGMIDGKEVSWLPSYGPEMRGGTANCHVMYSDMPVGSPIVTEATTLITLNGPATDKFEPVVKPGGDIFVNSSIVERKIERNDVNAFYVPANDIANELGNSRIINMVMLGAYLERSKLFSEEIAEKALRHVLGASKEKLIPINIQAMREGAKHIK
ncbi:MAG: 2-oxoacid:acceptor oxidoreductase family protein [Clostridia bacterium]|nr:2-oxoacid:acceptor oxidoreductase family protein [Clostridia bacterium]